MVRKLAAKRRAQQRSRRRLDLPVRRTIVKSGSAIADGMAETSATAVFSPTTTKKP